MAVTNRYELIGDIYGGSQELRLLAGRMNGLREAIKRRADLVGASVTLPPVLAADDPARLGSWLTAARGAIESILATNRYGRLVRNQSTGECPWVPWSKYDLITKIRTGWNAWGWSAWVGVNNSYTWTPGEWMMIPGPETPWWGPEYRKFHFGYYNELVLACELLVFAVISPGITRVSGERKQGNGYAMPTIEDAYWTAFTQYYTNTWVAAGPTDADGTRYLQRDYYTGTWNCSMYGARQSRFDVSFPSLLYNIKEFFMSYRANWNITAYGMPAGISAWDQANFSGNVGIKMGRLWAQYEWWSGITNWVFDGWMYWPSDWNNVTRPFSNRFDYIEGEFLFPEPPYYGVPAPSRDYLNEHQSPLGSGFGFGPSFGRFDFDGYVLGSTYWNPENTEQWQLNSF